MSAHGERRAPSDRSLRLLVTVTFNPNQLRAHLEPLLDIEEVEEITLVTDVPPPSMPGLRAVVPPRRLVRCLGRAGAKAVVCAVEAHRRRPDWVIGFNLVPHGMNAVMAAHLARTRSLYVMIGGPMEWEGGGWHSENRLLRRQRRSSALLERVLLAAARQATAVVTMGNAGRQRLIQCAFDPDRVFPIPASVDVERFTPSDNDTGRPHRWDVITVAELHPRKRLLDLLEAVARLIERDMNPRVAIVGEGEERVRLEARIAELGVGSNVELLGFRLDTSDLLRQARVFVLPSREEGLSIALLEAMASALPVVVSDVGEARDVVLPSRTGFVYPAGDITALTNHLAELLADTGLSTRLGMEARRVAVAHASREHVAAVYQRVLTTPGPGRGLSWSLAAADPASTTRRSTY